MSRRKQANPRPLKELEEEVNPNEETNKAKYAMLVEDVIPDDPDSDQDLANDGFDEYGPLVVDTSGHEHDDDDGKDNEDRLDPAVLSSLGHLQENDQLSPEAEKDQSVYDTENKILNSVTNSDSNLSGSITPSISPSDQLSPRDSSLINTPSKSHNRRGSKNISKADQDLDLSKAEADSSDQSKILPVSTDKGDSRYICPICQDVLSTDHELTVHIRTHNNNHNSHQSNSCTICGKLLSSQSSLDRHMLVHSGERPFKCKICKMSFTTNGNMHRHSRIHAKETDIASGGVKSNQRRKNTWKPKIHFFVPPNNSGQNTNLHASQLPGEITPDFKPQTFNFGETSTPNERLFAGAKRRFNFVDCSPDWSIPAAKRQYFGQNFPSELSKHLTGDIQIDSKELPLKVNQLEEQIQEKPVQIQNQKPLTLQEHNSLLQDKHSDNPSHSNTQNHHSFDEEKDTDQLHCPICNKAFLCKYGLATHMETHPESSMKCQICHMSFPTRRGLSMHRLLVHSKARSSESDDEKTAVVGFYDLCFIDFAVKKFPLVAKSWCEENSRKSSSAYHNFVCKECCKAFPCKSALLLHQHTHTPEKTAQCPLCECDFMDSQQLHVHMVKHISDKAFDELQLTIADKENHNPESMGQQDFLGMVGLTTSKEYGAEKHKKEKETKKESVMNLEKSENNDYFAKLGQVFSSAVPPIHPFFKYPDEIPKDFMDFQKMLQNAASQGLMGMPNQFGHLMQGMEHLSKMNQSQLAAFMPSMLPFGLNPSMSNFSAMAAMMNASMMHAMSNQNLSSPLPTPPPSSDGGSGGSGSSGEILEQKGSFPCKYCDMVFPNYRMLKGHTRTHLGLSPYKCNLCSYSSADKSTLIRHLRTHNGERPFQCRVCDFAFTTKANCERHVRKKHGKNTKDDIEGAIGYNKYVVDSSNARDSFHSPDTVCKYCGVDFKFFRALKHHLRSHSSCRQKPFMCTRCDVGFSSKANCVRHLQKQHAEISQNQIESYIHVNEPALTMDDGDNSTCDSISDDGYPTDLTGRNNEVPSLLAEKLSAPPAAHSTPKLSITPTDSRQGSPLMMKKEPVFVKSEPITEPEDKPLDFSVKQNDAMAKHNGDHDSKPPQNCDETPIDLTVKKRDDTQNMSSQMKHQIPAHSKVQYDSNHFQCQFCPMGFSNIRLLERHTWTHHTHLAGMLESKPLFMPSYPGAPAEHQSVGGKLKLPIKPPVTTDQGISKARAEILNRLPNILQKRKKHRDIGSPNNYGSDSSNDLASVKKMLDATNPHKFQAFLNENMGDSDISSQGDDRVFDDSRMEDQDMPEISGSESNLSLARDMSDEPPMLSPPMKGDNESSDGKCDEDMPEIMNQVRELVKHVDKFKNESRSSTPRSLSEGVDTKNLIKKKRNSYADSPHKLSCPYCTRTFPWVSSLTRHLLTHTGQKPFKCPRCPVTFSTKSNRERHLIRKHGVNMLDPLSRQTMDRPYKCHLCVFSSFSTQGNLLKHYKERHAGCNLPKALADLDKAVTVGLSRNARDSPCMDGEMLDESGMKLDDSLDNSMTRSELDQLDKSMEYERSDERFILDLKDEEEDVEDDEENQSPAKTEDIMKPFCSSTETPMETDLKALQLSTEMAKLSELRMNAEMRINAEMRMNELRQQAVFNIPDMEQVKPFAGTGERQINPERDNYNVDKITECWKCTEKFSSRKLLVRHLKEHNIDLPFKCYLCDASYEIRKECLLHQEKFHNSDWNILKDKNKVDEIETFSIHMDKVVENNINKVDTGAVLEIPGQNADDPKMEVVSADYMQRKVYCSLCPKRFWSLQDLRRHMRSHTGERPFECDICQKRFTLKHSMMRHRKKHMESGSLSPSDDEDNSQTEDLSKSGPSKSLPKLPLPPLVPSTVPISLNTSMNGETLGESRGRYGIAGPSTMMSSTPTVIKVDSKDSNDNSADILHNLLGVDATSIDKMLDSADTASFMLGFN